MAADRLRPVAAKIVRILRSASAHTVLRTSSLVTDEGSVRKALASHEPPRYVRAAKGSIVDAVEPQIRALLAEFPDTPTS